MYVTAPLLPFMVQIGVWGIALAVALSLHEPKAEKGPKITSHLSEALRISRYGLVEKKTAPRDHAFGHVTGTGVLLSGLAGAAVHAAVRGTRRLVRAGLGRG